MGVTLQPMVVVMMMIVMVVLVLVMVVVVVTVMLMMIVMLVSSSWNVELAVHRDPSWCTEICLDIGNKSSHRLPAAY